MIWESCENRRFGLQHVDLLEEKYLKYQLQGNFI